MDPTSPARIAEATRRLCAELLAWNRLRAGDVVAARFFAGEALDGSPLAAARAAGWTGIPLFLTRSPAERARLEVEAHVRLARRRKLRPLELA